MVEVDTFLTLLYLMVDDFCKTLLPAEAPRPGPAAALSRTEVVTLALFGPGQAFGRERGFYRYPERHWRGAFPTLPARPQFNRLVRHHHGALVACFLPLLQRLQGQACAYQALETLAVPTRDAKRGGKGWLPALADLGWRKRLGWDEGFHRLLAVKPRGGSLALALAQAAPRISRWRRPFSPGGLRLNPRCPVSGQWRTVLT